MLKFFAVTNQTCTVENNDQRAGKMCKCRQCRRQPVDRSRRNTNNDKQYAEKQILIYHTARLSGKPNKERQPLQIIAHQAIDAEFIATSLPAAPIAIPRSPAASAGASLIPSPTTATLWPSALKLFDYRKFILRQAVCLYISAAKFGGDAMSHFVPVAGKHCYSL